MSGRTAEVYPQQISCEFEDIFRAVQAQSESPESRPVLVRLIGLSIEL